MKKSVNFSLVLDFELVPRTAWFSNVRSMVSKNDWDILRKECYMQAGHVCEICGGKGPKHPVEAHEVWAYNDKAKIQKLIRLIALCPACHDVKHIGNAIIRAKENDALHHVIDELLRHFLVVNNVSEAEASKAFENAMNVFEKRSKHEWSCDITWLDTKGIAYNPERQKQIENES